ncbi:hypothetical protein JDV02_003406 [Purpureocillium takamizusanense]|uniref:Uncharacterized protein n=1 Tax=Purpureocillium takamizusanense TaxID=2060973 RepID=A0A9Q8V9Q7_9HYPO|nr:uncharacterized protein JDV02_003406 [Purpureocillium takamizusanense]UNI17027.1 hypothetical protein JDV02_003406 [Purpureocillium takamizusanense]
MAGSIETNDNPTGVQIGSNRAGPHPSSLKRPVDLPEWHEKTPTAYKCGQTLIGEGWAGRGGDPFRVIVMGAGAAGIDFLHQAPKALTGLYVDIKCFEKNSDVGGTWYENRYPGCACDVPSASYQFPWRPNPDWTEFYSHAPEIWQYMKGIVLDEGLDKYIQLNTKVVSAAWDEADSRWVVGLTTTDGTRKWEERCDVFLNGGGILNAWKWPDIPGLHSFSGRLFHTAQYQEGYDLKGKRVAVIGSGSSGVQTVVSVYGDVSKLYTWVRSPTWITTSFAQKFAGNDGSNFAYSEESKMEWRRNPARYLEYRRLVERELNQRFKFVLRNTRESQEANECCYGIMRSKLRGDKRLLDKIIPQNFNAGCRRPIPDNGYLDALVGAKTTCFTENIHSITPAGFKDQRGNEYEVDVIICATGFDTSFRPTFPVLGLDQVDLAERWREIPESYLGIAAPKMPNYFMFMGPFTPVAQGSILPIITHTSKYFIQVIRKMYAQHIRRISPKDVVVNQFMEHCRAYLPRTCWADPCASWFKQGRIDGPIVMWPGTRLAFFQAVESPNWEDFDIEYHSGNRFGFLGNGFAACEFSNDGDTTQYLDCESVLAPPQTMIETLLAASRT